MQYTFLSINYPQVFRLITLYIFFKFEIYLNPVKNIDLIYILDFKAAFHVQGFSDYF